MNKVYRILTVYLTVVDFFVFEDLVLVGLQLLRSVIMVHGYIVIPSWSHVRYPLCVFVFAENSYCPHATILQQTYVQRAFPCSTLEQLMSQYITASLGKWMLLKD